MVQRLLEPRNARTAKLFLTPANYSNTLSASGIYMPDEIYSTERMREAKTQSEQVYATDSRKDAPVRGTHSIHYAATFF
jgi:hypothetical protein